MFVRFHACRVTAPFRLCNLRFFFWDGDANTAPRPAQSRRRRRRISMLGALVPPAASAGPAANRGWNLLSDVYDRCLQVSSMCSWSIPSRIRNMMAHGLWQNLFPVHYKGHLPMRSWSHCMPTSNAHGNDFLDLYFPRWSAFLLPL